MKLDKTLENLKKLHTGYVEEERLLSEKLQRVQVHLNEVKEKVMQTWDAIQALEGKPTLAKMLETASSGAAQIPESPKNGQEQSSLPAPEAGMKWVKNELGEDVLVPINPPAPKKVPAIINAESFVLPAIKNEEKFENPETFLK